MRIEENFRDTKCPHYGLGLKKSLTKEPQRMAILLLIAAIATFAAWLAGLITLMMGKASDFQAHSAKFTQSLSIVYLGREALRKGLMISKEQLINSLSKLISMINEHINMKLFKNLPFFGSNEMLAMPYELLIHRSYVPIQCPYYGMSNGI